MSAEGIRSDAMKAKTMIIIMVFRCFLKKLIIVSVDPLLVG
jgi:hypothetical protein